MTETDEDYGDFIKKKVVVEKRETFMKLLKHLRVNYHGQREIERRRRNVAKFMPMRKCHFQLIISLNAITSW